MFYFDDTLYSQWVGCIFLLNANSYRYNIAKFLIYANFLTTFLPDFIKKYLTKFNSILFAQSKYFSYLCIVKMKEY